MRFKLLPLLLAFAFQALTAVSATAAQSPAKVEEADLVHNVNHDFGKQTFTWSDGTSAVYGLNYKPLIINGSLINADVKTVNDRTLVPVRAIAENLGCSVSWDEKSQKVTILKDGKRIEMTIGSTALVVNGLKKSMDASPAIHDGYTYLPVRFVSENLDAEVSYRSGGDMLIVSGVQGNVIVDQEIAAVAISKEQAVKTVKDASSKAFQEVKADFDNRQMDPGERVSIETGYKACEKNLAETKAIDEISRYYIIQGTATFLFDRYTGAFYIKGGDGASDWVVKYDPAAKDINGYFVRGYFAG